ncbi:MAG: HAD-IB family phosphatase [candidate division KSB1 bacterium]|nr:HAD-IB family phosphatase [candidate division KSB1 bacterium]
MKRQQVVLVDIDGTLLPASLEYWFLTFLLRTHRIQLGTLSADVATLLLHWPLPHWYQLKLIYLRGHSEETVRQWVQACWEERIRPRLFPGVVEIVRRFKSTGARVVLLSGTLRPLAEPLMKYLQISEALCAEPELEAGFYTGQLRGPYPRGRRKVQAADVWLQAEGYHWNQVCALANHWDDRFLLSCAQYAIIINPGWRLRRYARRHGWVTIENPNDPAESLSMP